MFEPESRSSVRDNLPLLVIFVVLVALIAVPAWLWKRSESARPQLAEVRVVSATSADPVFRDGARSVEADERVQLAIALRLTYRDGSSRWIAAVDQLVLDGENTEHEVTTRWPEKDRTARVFWFTLEAPVVGGRLATGEIQQKLTYRTFLAPELGNHWLVDGDPDHHADDLINLGQSIVSVNAGTYRPYARVEVSGESKTQHRQSATSLGPSEINNPRMVRIGRRLPQALGLDPEAGELFRLPGFVPEPDVEAELVQLAERRLATSSESLASLAAHGSLKIDQNRLTRLWDAAWIDGSIRSKAPPRWGSGIMAGDLLKQGDHWLVAVSDDGDGVLSAEDLVLHSWGRPPALMPFASAMAETPPTISLLRSR